MGPEPMIINRPTAQRAEIRFIIMSTESTIPLISLEHSPAYTTSMAGRGLIAIKDEADPQEEGDHDEESVDPGVWRIARYAYDEHKKDNKADSVYKSHSISFESDIRSLLILARSFALFV